MSVQGLVIGSRRGRRWLLAGGLAVGLAGVVAIAALGAEGTFTRLAASSVDELGGGYRVEAAGATFDLFRRFPLTGSGLGTFQAAFPLVQPPTIPGFWRHAHADWIEYLGTTGVLGALLLAGGLFFYGKRLRQVLRPRRTLRRTRRRSRRPRRAGRGGPPLLRRLRPHHARQRLRPRRRRRSRRRDAVAEDALAPPTPPTTSAQSVDELFER